MHIGNSKVDAVFVIAESSFGFLVAENVFSLLTRYGKTMCKELSTRTKFVSHAEYPYEICMPSV